MGRRPLNYTTKIGAKRTVGECMDLLADAGVPGVAVTYLDGEPAGLEFTLDTAGGRRDFSLPVDIDGMAIVLAKMLCDDRPHVSGGEIRRLESRAHARNVAWRVVRDWLEAQLALAAAGMASIDQVMLPYLQVGEGATLYDRYLAASGQLSITGGQP